MSSLTAILLAMSMAATARPPAPAPHCLDARAMSELRALDGHQLLIRSGTSRHQLVVAGDCPIAAEGAALLAPDGWVCGGPREYVRSGDRMCAVQRLQSLDEREYARLARSSDLAGVALLPGVESRERRRAWSGFTGSADYCFRPSQVRRWAATPDGIAVYTNKRLSGGRGQYRVEFANNCPEAATGSHLVLRSGVGIDLICGNAGDLAVIRGGPLAPLGIDNPSEGLSLTLATASSSAVGVQRGCRIAEVYPVEE